MLLRAIEAGNNSVASSWQKILSYFVDLSLEKSGSPYNPYLEVVLVNGRNQLITKDAIYSFDDKYENFYTSFKKIDWPNLKVKKALILGLGLGSVIYMLENNFKKRFSYDCVEIDPEIIRLAEKYSLNKIESPVQTFQTDAHSYVNITIENYDLILMDVFQSAKVPSKFETLDFLNALKSILNPNGLILYNRMNISHSDKKSNQAFLERFTQIFPSFGSIDIRNNKVLFSDKKFIK